ncbi:MAG: hypothetical protein KDI30_03720, partial [Pseudomonadales bacterium]|nr:hypothetical protein [Pseudomonadales bacterium]
MKTRFFHSPFSALAFSFLVIALGFISYVSTGHDDSHITFWASHTLLEQGEILNYNGDRIEQSSTLLFTLLIAATAFVTTINVIDSGYLLGIFFAGANIAMTLLVAQKAAINRPVALAIILASSPSYLFWSFSGMETTLTAFCILAFIYSWDTFRERKSA